MASDADHDPFAGLPDELRAMVEQLFGTAGMSPASAAGLFSSMPSHSDGPVNWPLAQRVAAEVAGADDREPTAVEQRRLQEALTLAELWLDTGGLPPPIDGGRQLIVSRTRWAADALVALRPMVDPVANAALEGLTQLARQQLSGMDEHDRQAHLDHLRSLGFEIPAQLEPLLEQLTRGDVGAMLQPASAAMTAVQAGQIVGALSLQMLGQYDLGIPTAAPGQATTVAVNVAEVFDGYGIDDTEIAVVLALHEAAHRRLFHAVGWLQGHLHQLIDEFAAGVEVDPERLAGLAGELADSIDPQDPDQLREAMERAARFRLEPTDRQRRTLERLQGVVCLVGAWARFEATHVAADRLPSLARIQEVLRRRRATRGDGEQLLSQLLGLDLKPADERVGDRFVAAVIDTVGSDGLRRALAHPENLPDAEELAEPNRWLLRTTTTADIPDDLSTLFDAPPPGGDGDLPGHDDGDGDRTP